MVNVVTAKGKFNISESLLEAIKSNNPELLVEGELINKLTSATSTDDYNNVKNILVMIGDSAKKSKNISADIKQDVDDFYDYVTELRKSSNKSSLDNRDTVINNLVDAFGNKDQASKFFKELLNTTEDTYDTMTNPEYGKNTITPDSQENTNTEAKKGNGVELMKQCLSNTDLIKQIAYTENLAGLLVEKCKKLIQRELGIWGDSTISNKSQTATAEYDKTTGQQTDINVNPYYNSTNYNKKIGSRNYNTGVDINGYDNNNTKATNVKDGVGNKTSLGRKLKSELQLAGGGFKFYPAFNSMADRDSSGKALKYYKSILQPTNKSLIDNMMDIEIALKDGAYDRDIQEAEDGLSIRRKFENMVFNYLHNVVYNLDINNPEKYNSIVRILSWDDKLKRDFNINNTANVQQFDVREQIIYFIKKTDGIPTLLIIAKPLFAKGSALAKTAYDTFGRYRLNRN